MFEASPVHPADGGRVVAFAGVGVQFLNFFGKGFKPVMRPVVRFRPAAIRINKVLGLKAIEAAFDIRYFYKRFNDSDFRPESGGDGATETDATKGNEFVTGAFVTFVF